MYKLLPILLFAVGFAVTTKDIYDNSYALIIGIDKYQNVRSLDYAVKDAEDIQSMLVDKFNFQQDNIVLLKDEEATKASIIQEFSNITKKAGANDRVLIFFAGHGETEGLPNGGEMGYLLPVDGNKTDLYVSAIEMNAIQTISLRSEAKHILYLIDACYGGIATVGARGFLDAESTPNYLQKITQYKSRQIISAGGRGEQVIEKSEWGHSAFTKNLLSGLRDAKADTDSDGIITAQELGTYLKRKVTIDSDSQQTPKIRNLSTDEGEFVFVYSENTAVIQDESTAKLDLVPSDKEELKPQESSDDGTILERIQRSKWRKTYARNLENPEVFGIGLNSLVEHNTLNHKLIIFGNVAEGTNVSFSYYSRKIDLLNKNIALTESLAISSDYIAIGIHTILHGLNTENMWLEGGGGMRYSKISWQAENNTSDDLHKITPWLISGIGFRPVPDLLPIIILNMHVLVTLDPQTYNEIDGIKLIDDWQVKFAPGFSISMVIPKFILFPK